MHLNGFIARGVCLALALLLPLAAQAADADIEAIYERSCKACHSTPASGAPQTGDTEAWKPRIAQGIDMLLDHTIDGYKAMPPMGMCMDCSEEQFLALIEYMSGSKLE